MGTTTFSGPIVSENGFTGNVTGNVTGDVTGTLIQPVATVAATGTVLANAAAVTTGVTLVTGGDGTKGVALPTAAAGLEVSLYSTAATLGTKVYANTSDTINGAASVTMEGSTWLKATAVNSVAWITYVFTADT